MCPDGVMDPIVQLCVLGRSDTVEHRKVAATVERVASHFSEPTATKNCVRSPIEQDCCKLARACLDVALFCIQPDEGDWSTAMSWPTLY